MKDFINNLYRNHSLIYKVLLYIITTIFIVYLFPTSGKFKYSFEKGKPWQSENLYAPFDFAIKKSAEELQEEQDKLKENASVYFDFNEQIDSVVLNNFVNQFNLTFTDSISKLKKLMFFNFGKNILTEAYSNGILDKDYNYADNKSVVILKNRVQVRTGEFSQFIKQGDIRTYLEEKIALNNLQEYNADFLSIFFNVIKPNIKLNKTLTDKSLQEELDKISTVRGSIERETLIISKGEIVEGDKYKILKSLESEYESQVWSEANYNWILLSYSLLVALA
ncbi:MAG: phosphohydrolase, partial [Flavobacteriaceae bacterium]|nr:phosphohydrolase [Flavobacteriaceae bacterium]